MLLDEKAKGGFSWHNQPHDYVLLWAPHVFLCVFVFMYIDIHYSKNQVILNKWNFFEKEKRNV